MPGYFGWQRGKKQGREQAQGQDQEQGMVRALLASSPLT